MAERRLRAVSSGESPNPPAARKPRASRARTVAGAAASGDQRALLVATRARVAKAIDNQKTPARDLAALTRRLLEIANEIAAIDLQADDKVSVVAKTVDESWDASAI